MMSPLSALLPQTSYCFAPRPQSMPSLPLEFSSNSASPVSLSREALQAMVGDGREQVFELLNSLASQAAEPFASPLAMPQAGISWGGFPPSGFGAPASLCSPSLEASNPRMQKLAQLADREVCTNRGNGRQCFNRVANSLDKMGIRLSGRSAYMAADQLARHPKVREIQVAREELPRLPAGAIVVWDRAPGRRHGHISISLGDGREASDVRRQQLTRYGPRFRVFLPL